MAMIRRKPADVYVWVDVPPGINTYSVSSYSYADDGAVTESVGSTRKLNAGGVVGFAGLLVGRLQNMFTDVGRMVSPRPNIFVVCIFGLRTVFGDDDNNPSQLRPADILDTDLLCYIRMSRALSLASAQELAIAPPIASGFTISRPTGVLSEAWFTESGGDPEGVANTIFHELMHNKTRFALRENADWVHGPQGGGGLAAALNAGSLAAFTLGNKRAMASRLSVRNKQFTTALR
jgi:hypothetical protein